MRQNRLVAAADVDLVRQLLGRWNAGDGALDLLHPEIEFNASDFPDGEIYHGHEGVGRFVRRWVGDWDEYELRVEDVIDGGDVVVALTRERGRTGGGLDVSLESLLAFWLRDGQVVRFRGYLDREAGMQELGLKPPA